ncbi:DnaD domain-containing protein [Bacillus suaedae]|uniref:DnaD domain-containing protein n=1 Tax=Halalkalibacter suaedae TaxID=2822140 RepID=A0A940WY82_9BACI|nr:DnaD domain-containing protein [Bacillus suaedae]MBP3950631.1 DnaD domain-containing protein [Bacillus suaedae]
MDQKVISKWTTQRFLSIPTLLFKHYKEIGLKEDELVALLHIQSFIDEGDQFPTPELISDRMTLSMSDCAELLGRLIKHGFVSIEKKWDNEGILFEVFSLEPLWVKLLQLLKGEEQQVKERTQQEEEGQLFKRFEEEFSRPLSPIEVETLSMWLDQDHHSPTLIIAALRESVVSGKLNFRYIDRILFEWKRNNVQTLEQARAHGEKFRKYNQPARQEKSRARVESAPGFQWLDQS